MMTYVIWDMPLSGTAVFDCSLKGFPAGMVFFHRDPAVIASRLEPPQAGTDIEPAVTLGKIAEATGLPEVGAVPVPARLRILRPEVLEVYVPICCG